MSDPNVLAPHLDDAVLSCWHQIELGSQVITLFAGTPDTSIINTWYRIRRHTNPSDTMLARIDENSVALQKTPSSINNLDYLDFQYKHPKRDIADLAAKVLDTANAPAPIIAAAGIGRYLRQHPDHKTTRKVAKELLEQGADVSFYADLPYMLPIRRFDSWPERLPIEKLKRVLDMNLEIEPHELSPERQHAKQVAVLAYTSQYKAINVLALGALRKSGAYRWEAIIRPI